jgi:O-succinylbenzoic acid--CoA ligase
MVLQVLSCRAEAPQLAADALANYLASDQWVQLLPHPSGSVPKLPDLPMPLGPGVVVASGGSSGQPRLCLHPLRHLQRSAQATAEWLVDTGISPEHSLVFNPLPFHHVSGLMPWWRSRQWGATHVWLSPERMKQPTDLLEFSKSQPGWDEKAVVLSLVPTQLARLIGDPAGRTWLEHFSVIWVGGAALSDELAQRARSAGLRLSPSYGATETAAMVTAVAPEAFLAGENGCGSPLVDVDLRQNSEGALQVRTPRLAACCWSADQPNQLLSLTDAAGWWTSGDAALLEPSQLGRRLLIQGRLDGALLSGGEVVFPERLEQCLWRQAQSYDLPLRDVLIVGIPHPVWGQQLVALVCAKKPEELDALLAVLPTFSTAWSAAEQPKRWLGCAELKRNAAGKWDRSYWRDLATKLMQ